MTRHWYDILFSLLLRSAKSYTHDQRVKVRLGVAEFAIYIPNTVRQIYIDLLVKHLNDLGQCYEYHSQLLTNSTFFGKDMIS